MEDPGLHRCGPRFGSVVPNLGPVESGTITWE